MYCTKRISDSLTWIGGNDRRLAMFEGVYSVPNGVSYNSYILKDEKIAVFDTVDKAVSKIFFENLEHELDGGYPDYLIIHHMEPDHAATLDEFCMRYPNTKIVCNAKILAMIKQFFEFDIDARAVVVNEGDTLSLGAHTLNFIYAPMVHWPEVMMSYEEMEGILFSADAFGHFGALNGAIFADEVDFDRDYMDEARRYYSNIVGKYGAQVMSVFRKAQNFDIKMICPLHGFVWRRDLASIMDKYKMWATYTPEKSGVMIAYASIYGNTENAAEILSSMLREKGIETVMFDVSVSPASDIVSAAFKYSHLVFASPTYNAGIFVSMDDVIRDVAAHMIKNRTVAFIQNGSWAPSSGKLMREIIEKIPGNKVIEDIPYVKSSVKADSYGSIKQLCDTIASDFPKKADEIKEIDNAAIESISYGLYAVFTNDGVRHNASIINTVSQVTSSPLTLSIYVNKANYTCETILKTGVFNISVLDQSTPFDVFKRFGFASGRDTDKLAGFDAVSESSNGIKYMTDNSCAYISCKVTKYVDRGTHMVFFADVTEAHKISDTLPITYAYYFEHVKPKAAIPSSLQAEGGSDGGDASGEKRIIGWECKICGYVYEGAELPSDFVCPLCKHPASDFVPIYA